ncbi:MAG: hypothetical protein R3321_15065, partial [Nitrososphaeraceae archaeon]|nr:hypothetical protein [Nitrososphaeraceae archaeon]
MRYLLAILLILFSFSTYAQKVTVLEEGTGQAIELVTVISQDPKEITSTNSEGKADISEFKDSELIQFHMY